MKRLSNQATAFIFALGFGISAAEAGVNLSNVPLQTGATVPPNVMFLLDDSGSMRWGFMPDELVTRLVISGDRDIENCTNVVSYGGYSNLCALNMAGRNYLTSSHLNKAYYDPKLTYSPPVRADGSLFPNASFSAAWIDGYNSNSATVNLLTGYRALMDD